MRLAAAILFVPLLGGVEFCEPEPKIRQELKRFNITGVAGQSERI